MSVGLTSTHIFALAIDPLVPSTLYAGTFKNGVFKSTDGGASWTPANTGLPAPPPPGAFQNPMVHALVIDPNNPATLYAAVNDEWSLGVFSSGDGGANWVKTGLRAGTFIPALAIDPSNSLTLYAASDGQGVFKTTDGGVSWSAANNGLTRRGR